MEEDKSIEETLGESFKKKIVELMSMQQEANKQNLILHISNLIVNILLFIMLIIIVVLK